ncbi:hypothetical protein [Secundilactobacillus silagincola]|nr:hypothetical protein [Secundilactobacillus silagincola]
MSHSVLKTFCVTGNDAEKLLAAQIAVMRVCNLSGVDTTLTNSN